MDLRQKVDEDGTITVTGYVQSHADIRKWQGLVPPDQSKYIFEGFKWIGDRLMWRWTPVQAKSPEERELRASLSKLSDAEIVTRAAELGIHQAPNDSRDMLVTRIVARERATPDPEVPQVPQSAQAPQIAQTTQTPQSAQSAQSSAPKKTK